MNVQCVIQDNGNGAVVMFLGRNKQSVLEHYYSCYNLAATSGEFYWFDNGEGPVYRGYLWTTMEKMDKWFFDSSLRMVINKNPDVEDEDDLIPEAKKLAEFRRNRVIYGNVLSVAAEADLVPYTFRGDHAVEVATV